MITAQELDMLAAARAARGLTIPLDQVLLWASIMMDMARGPMQRLSMGDTGGALVRAVREEADKIPGMARPAERSDLTPSNVLADYLEENAIPGAHIVRSHARLYQEGGQLPLSANVSRGWNRLGTTARRVTRDQTPFVLADRPQSLRLFDTQRRQESVADAPLLQGYAHPELKQYLIAVAHAPQGEPAFQKGVVHAALTHSWEELLPLLTDFPKWAKKIVVEHAVKAFGKPGKPNVRKLARPTGMLPFSENITRLTNAAAHSLGWSHGKGDVTPMSVLADAHEEEGMPGAHLLRAGAHHAQFGVDLGYGRGTIANTPPPPMREPNEDGGYIDPTPTEQSWMDHVNEHGHDLWWENPDDDFRPFSDVEVQVPLTSRSRLLITPRHYGTATTKSMLHVMHEPVGSNGIPVGTRGHLSTRYPGKTLSYYVPVESHEHLRGLLADLPIEQARAIHKAFGKTLPIRGMPAKLSRVDENAATRVEAPNTFGERKIGQDATRLANVPHSFSHLLGFIDTLSEAVPNHPATLAMQEWLRTGKADALRAHFARKPTDPVSMHVRRALTTRPMKLARERLSHHRKGDSVTLYHYADPSMAHEASFTTDPTRLGQNPWSQAERKATGFPRTLFYVDPADKEGFFSGKPLFTADYPADKIYDAAADPEGHAADSRNVNDLLSRLRGAGYHGIFYSGVFPTVAMWSPVTVHRVEEQPQKLAERRAIPGPYNTTHDQLLNAVRSFSYMDETPSNAYADWMEEHGEPGAGIVRASAPHARHSPGNPATHESHYARDYVFNLPLTDRSRLVLARSAGAIRNRRPNFPDNGRMDPHWVYLIRRAEENTEPPLPAQFRRSAEDANPRPLQWEFRAPILSLKHLNAMLHDFTEEQRRDIIRVAHQHLRVPFNHQEPEERPQKLARSNVYVSSNTNEGTQMQDAYRMLAGPEHAALVAATPGGQSGYGVWTDGAEDARMFPVTDPNALASVAESLAKQFKQKAVAVFDEDPLGPDALHIVPTRETDPEKVNRDTIARGIDHKTILSSPEGLLLHILDPGKQLQRAIEEYAASVGASPESYNGKVDFLGTK